MKTSKVVSSAGSSQRLRLRRLKVAALYHVVEAEAGYEFPVLAVDGLKFIVCVFPDFTLRDTGAAALRPGGAPKRGQDLDAIGEGHDRGIPDLGVLPERCGALRWALAGIVGIDDCHGLKAVLRV